MKALQYIFVHGLCGWGSYDPAYKRMPYWGMRGGDLLAPGGGRQGVPRGFGRADRQRLGPGV